MDTNEPSGQRHLTSNAEDDQSLTQIREILFGDHRRQTRQQIAALEARLDEWDTAFRQMLDQRIHQALEDLRNELDNRGLRQQAALDGLDSTFRTLLAKTDDRLALLDSGLEDITHHLRHSLNEQASAQDAAQRRKVERTQLADLLEGMARQLREQDT